MFMCVAHIDLTMAFDQVFREGSLKILSNIGCPPKVHYIIKSMHTTWRGEGGDWL